MARPFLIMLLSIASRVAAQNPTNTGMEISGKAYDLVCWYEGLQHLYPGPGTKFGHCEQRIAFQAKHYIKELKRGVDEEAVKNAFATAAERQMSEISTGFSDACNKYLKDPQMAPAADANNESELLDEGARQNTQYPFKGFVHCLMQHLHKTYGQQAIDSLKEKKTDQRDWKNVLNDRDNEYRARHGVPPLTLDTQLSKDAQAYAEKISTDCLSSRPHEIFPHSKPEERQFNGQNSGENIFMMPTDAKRGTPQKENMALYASNEWYSEIQYYDYATGDSVEPGNPEKAVGHFTQTVWKDSKLVGYGYAYNPNCNGPIVDSVVIVARYSPPGNYQGLEQHQKNVLPLKH